MGIHYVLKNRDQGKMGILGNEQEKRANRIKIGHNMAKWMPNKMGGLPL